jgi:hypothetical protein
MPLFQFTCFWSLLSKILGLKIQKVGKETDFDNEIVVKLNEYY